jgi:rsbT co-antagonist protein RsbR
MLAREMGLTEQATEQRRRIVGLGPEDLQRIVAIRELVLSRIDQFSAVFFDYLGTLEEGRPLTGNRQLLERARELQRQHLAGMVGGEYGKSYAEQRLELAALYSRLELRVFLAAFHHLLRSIGAAIIQHFEQSPREGFENFMALKKVAYFDIGVIVDGIVFERERVIRQQQDAIRELSTPVLQIRERLLLVPIIGIIDTHRASLITENLLRAIRANRAKVVVTDITGVATIDSRVANHLMQTVTAAKLMGAVVVVTGLSAEVAQSLVALGIDLTKLNTVGDLQGGLEEAERLLGYRVVQTDRWPPERWPTEPASLQR